jgi:TIR domain
LNPVRLFISHAFEDKADFVSGLAKALDSQKEFKVWYDEYSLRLGDSLLESISKGLHECDYGIVVFSPSFFKKKWTALEMDGLFAKETTERKVILPIWHQITRDDLLAVYSPFADRYAVKSYLGIPAVVEAVRLAVGTGDRTRQVEDPVKQAFSELGDMIIHHDLNEHLSRTEEGVELVKKEVFRLFYLFDTWLDQVPAPVNLQRNRRDQMISLSHPNATVSAMGRFGITVAFEYVNHFTNTTERAGLSVTIYTPDYDKPSVLGKRKVLESSVFLPRFTADRSVYWTEEDQAGAYSSEQIVEVALVSFKEAIATRLQNPGQR